MTRHILCAVDLTHGDAEQALLREAAALADFHGATLSVVTVIPDYGMTIVGSFFKEGTMKDALQAASDQLHVLVAQALPGRDAVQHIVKSGTVYEEVLDAVDIAQADLIVIGAHKPDLADRLQGPNSSRVVRKSPCSVLVVRS
ncbi:MAG: universal stress protein [Pelagimonas sp.]|jgi:nucleotide-binding universal stress UspA family protein|nr:universal stress protein [Pelagimonas sp.]